MYSEIVPSKSYFYNRSNIRATTYMYKLNYKLRNYHFYALLLAILHIVI